MISSLLTLVVSAFAPEGVSAPDLFAKLDKNSDGKVTQTEMAGSQQSMFKRALRVADLDEDGALNKDEFSKAVSDPRPVELPGANMGERMATFRRRSPSCSMQTVRAINPQHKISNKTAARCAARERSWFMS